MEHGLTEEKIAQLDAAENEYTEREQCAIDFAEQLARDHQAIDDAYFARLQSQFTDAEIIELGMMVGQYIGFGRLLAVLDLTPEP